jgi:hypothetical protein
MYWHLHVLKIQTGTLFAMAEVGRFFHKIFNAFWSCELVFKSQRWPQHSVGADTMYWHIHVLKTQLGPCFAIAKVGPFFTKFSMLFGLVSWFSNPKGGLNIVSLPTLCIGTSIV